MQTLAQQLLVLNGISFYSLVLRRFQDEAINKAYNVYLVDIGADKYVMKSGRREFENYRRWFGDSAAPVPHVFPQPIVANENLWFLMEYLPGHDLRGAAAETVLSAAARLAELHSRFWQQPPSGSEADRYIDYFRRFIPRFPDAPALQNSLRELTDRMHVCPRTLIHDDLLPINVHVTNCGIYFLDWDYCGRYPYFMDICRLLVHEAGELGSSFSPEVRAAAFQTYYDTLTASGCTELSPEAYQNDIRLGTIAELVSCLQPEDRALWSDFAKDYYRTVVELSS